LDYQGNTNKDKEKSEKKQKKEDKKLEKVVTGVVIQKPPGIGRKFKDIFFGGDFKLAMRYVASDVLLPAFRNLLVDSVTKGAERVVYGEVSGYRRRPTGYGPITRVQYNNPLMQQRPVDPRDPRQQAYLPDQPRLQRANRHHFNDVILISREEAELVVERMIDIIDKYDAASLSDLYVLLGLNSSPIDNKWGWTFLNNVEIRQVRDGFLIELPELEEI
jgi:hypothetical protein